MLDQQLAQNGFTGVEVKPGLVDAAQAGHGCLITGKVAVASGLGRWWDDGAIDLLEVNVLVGVDPANDAGVNAGEVLGDPPDGHSGLQPRRCVHDMSPRL